VSKIQQGAGKKVVGHDKPAAGDAFDLGPTAFNFGLELVPGRANGTASLEPLAFLLLIAQAPVLDPFTPRSAKGGAAHLDVRQTYEKDLRTGASLRITIRDIKLETADADGPLTPSECPVVGTTPCSPIRSVVRYHARAYAASPARCQNGPSMTTPFFSVGGAVYTEGSQHR
jgi:hypothetical protein